MQRQMNAVNKKLAISFILILSNIERNYIMLNSIQQILEKKLVPVSEKLSNNKMLKAISAGMMLTLPLTLGASVFLILASFPVPIVSEWLINIGLAPHLNAIAGGTLSILALFVSFTVAYNYAKNEDSNAIIAAIFSLSSFMILAPQSIGTGDEIVQGFQMNNLGSTGLFVALFTSLLVSTIYVKLNKNGKLILKLPETVPPMVSQSIEPLFIGLIIYAIILVLRIGFALTSYEDIFVFVNEVIATPLTSIGGSIPALLLVYVIGNLFFFFGLHPAAIYGILQPIIFNMTLTTVENLKNGESLQYLENLVTYDFINNDGTGSTLSLILAILIFCKSKRYRTFSKIALGPNIFNINEPVVFGLPIMFNPILAIPFVFSSLISGSIGFLAVKIGFITTYNANVALSLPWTLPKLISSFFIYGWQGIALRIFILGLLIFVYLPFCKVLDNKELIAEKELTKS